MSKIVSIIVSALAILGLTSYTAGAIGIGDKTKTENTSNPPVVQKVEKKQPEKPKAKEEKPAPKQEEQKPTPKQEEQKEDTKPVNNCPYCQEGINTYEHGYSLAQENYDYMNPDELYTLAYDMGLGTCDECIDNCKMGIQDYVNKRLEENNQIAQQEQQENKDKICSICHNPYSKYGCSDDICFSPEAKGMN